MEALKDVSMIIIAFLVELFEGFFKEKIKFQIQLSIRILIGCCINFIELGIAISESSNEALYYFLIALLCPTLCLTILVIFYLIFSCKFSKTIDSFDQLNEKKLTHCSKITKTSFWLVVILKLLGIAISIMLIFNGLLRNDNELVSKYFTMYGIIDLLLTFSSLLRSLLEKVIFKFLIKEQNTIFTDETNEKINNESKDSNINIFYALFGCVHLLILPMLAKHNSRKSLNEFDKGNIDLAKKLNKKSKIYNRIFIFLFILSTVALIIILSFFLQGNLNQPIDCSGRKGDTFIYIKPEKKTRIYCVNGSVILFFRGTYKNFNKLTYDDYKNGFSYNYLISGIWIGADIYGDTYWLGLDNLNILLSKRNFTIRIATSYSTYYEFDNFKVGDESDGYRLSLSDLKNFNTFNFFSRYNQMKFSTFDNDQDNDSSNNCALKFGEGWWYNSCATNTSIFYPQILTMSLK
jgi:hypothetical protein